MNSNEIALIKTSDKRGTSYYPQELIFSNKLLTDITKKNNINKNIIENYILSNASFFPRSW
jgi:hypothetical protein